MNLPEEKQEFIIRQKTSAFADDKEVNRANTDDENVFTERGNLWS